MVDSNRFDSIEFLNLGNRKSYKFLSRGIKDYFLLFAHVVVASRKYL
jgi:hypothetical protein